MGTIFWDNKFGWNEKSKEGQRGRGSVKHFPRFNPNQRLRDAAYRNVGNHNFPSIKFNRNVEKVNFAGSPAQAHHIPKLLIDLESVSPSPLVARRRGSLPAIELDPGLRRVDIWSKFSKSPAIAKLVRRGQILLRDSATTRSTITSTVEALNPKLKTETVEWCLTTQLKGQDGWLIHRIGPLVTLFQSSNWSTWDMFITLFVFPYITYDACTHRVLLNQLQRPSAAPKGICAILTRCQLFPKTTPTTRTKTAFLHKNRDSKAESVRKITSSITEFAYLFHGIDEAPLHCFLALTRAQQVRRVCSEVHLDRFSTAIQRQNMSIAVQL